MHRLLCHMPSWFQQSSLPLSFELWRQFAMQLCNIWSPRKCSWRRLQSPSLTGPETEHEAVSHQLFPDDEDHLRKTYLGNNHVSAIFPHLEPEEYSIKRQDISLQGEKKREREHIKVSPTFFFHLLTTTWPQSSWLRTQQPCFSGGCTQLWWDA